MSGRVAGPVLIFGSVSFLLALFTELMGIFAPLDARLKGALGGLGGDLEKTTGVMGLSGFLVAVLFCYGLVWMILSTPEMWRRVMLGMTTMVVAALFVPSFAVWGIYWQPFPLALGLLWAMFSGLIYAESHRMPCERSEAVPVSGENVIRMDESRPTQIPQRKKR